MHLSLNYVENKKLSYTKRSYSNTRNAPVDPNIYAESKSVTIIYKHFDLENAV